jgi:hypothetical protein
MQMRLMLGLRRHRNSFFGAEVLMAAALKLLLPVLDAQVVPNHVADHRNEYDDQKDVNHSSKRFRSEHDGLFDGGFRRLG